MQRCGPLLLGVLPLFPFELNSNRSSNFLERGKNKIKKKAKEKEKEKEKR
jgi:hypothetical protein